MRLVAIYESEMKLYPIEMVVLRSSANLRLLTSVKMETVRKNV
jgi:hypothetical protein